MPVEELLQAATMEQAVNDLILTRGWWTDLSGVLPRDEVESGLRALGKSEADVQAIVSMIPQGHGITVEQFKTAAVMQSRAMQGLRKSKPAAVPDRHEMRRRTRTMHAMLRGEVPSVEPTVDDVLQIVEAEQAGVWPYEYPAPVNSSANYGRPERWSEMATKPAAQDLSLGDGRIKAEPPQDKWHQWQEVSGLWESNRNEKLEAIRASREQVMGKTSKQARSALCPHSKPLSSFQRGSLMHHESLQPPQPHVPKRYDYWPVQV
jgi:hypothetical protein